MNPFIQDVALSVARKALTAVATYLVTSGWITGEQSERIIVGIALGAVSVGWSIWQRYKDRILLAIGLGLPQGSSISDALKVYDSNKVDNPSVSQPTNAASPKLSTTKID
jgi:ABC-type enterobactin transport system permease subunit